MNIDNKNIKEGTRIIAIVLLLIFAVNLGTRDYRPDFTMATTTENVSYTTTAATTTYYFNPRTFRWSIIPNHE